MADSLLSGAEPIVVGSGTKTGIKIMYDRPQDVGADRIVDAVAAFHLAAGAEEKVVAHVPAQVDDAEPAVVGVAIAELVSPARGSRDRA